MLDKEIVDDFRAETNALISELYDIVENLESYTEGSPYPQQDLADFSQKIDRIMGAAQTLSTLDESHQGLKRIGKISELCKGLGYSAAQNENSKSIPIFAAFWADTLELIEKLVETLDDAEKSDLAFREMSALLQKRLEWLTTKIKKGKAFGVSESASDSESNLSNEMEDQVNDILKQKK